MSQGGEPSKEAGGRDAALDVFRGIAILEVVTHHVTGFARLHADPATFTNTLLTVANRTLHFAVPAFLFLMALVLTRSMLAQKWSWAAFFTRRFRQSVVPYLLWTGIYAGFALWHGKTDWAAFQRWETWGHWLLWGKAWDHLYFLVLAIQLYLFLPLLLLWIRRRPGIAQTLVAGAVAQLAFYVLNHLWFRASYPGSLLFWHLVPVVAGAAVGARLEAWDETWRRFRWLFILLAGIGCLAYVPQGVRELRGLSNHPLTYQLAFWTYTTGLCFCLLALCRTITRRLDRRFVRAIQHLGSCSMPIYLVHPMLLYFWYRTVPSGSTLILLLSVLLAITAAIGVSLLFYRLTRWLRLSTLLFGRDAMPLAPLPEQASRR